MKNSGLWKMGRKQGEPYKYSRLNSESYQGVVQGGETQEAPKGHPELKRCS